MFDVSARLKQLEKDIGPLKTDVAALMDHRRECDSLHAANAEYHKRSDDAIKQNTESNILLAKAMVGLNATVTTAVETIKKDRPIIKLMEDARTAWGVNKWLFLTFISIASGAAVIITFYKDFLLWLKTMIL